MNEDRDYLDLTDIPAHLHGFEVLKHKATWRLDEALQGQGIDIPADQLFINSVNNPVDRVVTSSTALPTFIANAVLENNHPVITDEFSGVFGVAFSFQDEHRIDSRFASIETFAAIASDVYQQLQG